MTEKPAGWALWTKKHPRLLAAAIMVGITGIALGVWAYAGWVSYQMQNDAMLKTVPDGVAKEDLRAQQDMAEFAYGLLLWAAFGFVASIAGVAFVAFTITQNRRMIEATREIGQNQTRAYVLTGPAGAVINLSEDEHAIAITIVNAGETPATNVVVSAHLAPAFHTAERTSPLKFLDLSVPIVSGDQHVRLIVKKAELAKWRAGVEKAAPDGRFGTVRLIGAVNYTDVFQNRSFTGFFTLISADAWTQPRSEISLYPGVNGAFAKAT